MPEVSGNFLLHYTVLVTWYNCNPKGNEETRKNSRLMENTGRPNKQRSSEMQRERRIDRQEYGLFAGCEYRGVAGFDRVELLG